MQQRVYLFDTAKFFLIFLVIYGHMLQPNRALSYNSEIYSLIYMFHMPLFIMISGYFSKKIQEKKTFRIEWIRLFETFVVLHVFSFVYKYVAKGDVGIKDCLIPGFASWYLLALLYWRLILQYIPQKFLNYPILFITICVAVSLIAGYLPVGGALSVQRAFSMFPFFMLGYFLKQNASLNKVRLQPYVALIVIASFVIAVFQVNDFGNVGGGKNEFHNVMHCAYSYTKGNITIAPPIVCRFLFLVLSTLLSLAIISLIPHKNLGILTNEGRFTLFYYFWHSILVSLFLKVFHSLSFNNSSLVLLVGSVCVTIVLYSIRKFRIFNIFMTPFDYLHK